MNCYQPSRRDSWHRATRGNFRSRAIDADENRSPRALLRFRVASRIRESDGSRTESRSAIPKWSREHQLSLVPASSRLHLSQRNGEGARISNFQLCKCQSKEERRAFLQESTPPRNEEDTSKGKGPFVPNYYDAPTLKVLINKNYAR